MTYKLLKVVFCFSVLAIIFIGCTKDSESIITEVEKVELENNKPNSVNATNFSTYGYIERENKLISQLINRTYDPHIETVINDLLIKDASEPFIDALVDAFGYPSWQYAMIPDQLGGSLGITAFMKTTDNFISAIMTSAIRSDGSVEYGIYPREVILSSTYDLSLSNLITVTQASILTNSIFTEIDCDLQNKLLEEVEQAIEEDGLKMPQISDSRDCLEITVEWEQCTDYYSVSGDGSSTYLYSSCTTWNETYTTGCNGGYPGDNPGSGWVVPPDDGTGGPIINPNDDGQDTNTDSDNNNNNDNENPPTFEDELCNLYPLNCDCIRSLENKGSSETPDIRELIATSGNLIDPCNPGIDVLENAISKACSENSGSLTLSSLEEHLKVDKITNNLTDLRLKCIFEELTLDSDNIFCNSFENFLGNTEIDLNLQNSEQVVGYAQTTYYDENSPYGNTVDIAFNQNQMEQHCELTIVGAFLHEGIHAEMFRQLNDPNLNPNDFASVWDAYDSNISDHENMAQAYINNLINALEKRFGTKYSYDQYEAIA